MRVRNGAGSGPADPSLLLPVRPAAGQPRGELAVRLLGPLEVSIGGRPVELTAGRLRSLLALLAVSAGQTVPVSRLVAALWDGELPGNARRSVQTYLARLRSVLGPARIGTTAGGYVLNADPEDVDVQRFSRLLDAALHEPDAREQRERLATALALWRGRPFEDVQPTSLLEPVSQRLLERYYLALERRIDLDLAQGRHEELVAELGEHTTRHPLREPLWTRRLIVLDRCGRQAEALSCYEAIRVRIADELGVDPGPELRRIHADLLAGRMPSPVLGAGRRPVPQQLPSDLDVFVGRVAALKELDALLSAEGPSGQGASPRAGTVVAVVHGAAGVGKTSLATRWAHQVRDRFRDGQLYADLRGYGPGPAMEPAEAIRGFLDALGVAPHQFPAGELAQGGLYRSLLAGKRMLILLDNARSAEQIRPLLPGSPGCLAVVTSRHELSGLTAVEGAQSIELGLPSPADARHVLARRLGEGRLAAEPQAADEIIERCGRLPLALAVVAARAARPGLPLAALAAQLRGSPGDLDAFTTGDPGSELRTVFSWSYRALTAGAARLFRLLSLHPGPDVTPAAAASLAGLPARQAHALLAELSRAHLVDEAIPGRYSFHYLLLAYAAELAKTHDPGPEQRVALRRMLDHYLHTAHIANNLIRSPCDPLVVTPAGRGVTPENPADLQQALAWFTAERPVLLAMVLRAAAGFPAHAWQLAWSISPFLNRQGRWHDLALTQRTALDAASRASDQPGQSRAHHGLGMAYQQMGRLNDADGHFRSALELGARLGDHAGQARVHTSIAIFHEKQGSPADALRHVERALELYRQAGQRGGQARALSNVGWFHALLGDYDRAVACCNQAIGQLRELGDQHGEAAAWDSVGYAHQRLGDHQQAVDAYRSALALFRRSGGRYPEAKALIGIGDNYQAVGDYAAACAAWQDALVILDDLDPPEAQQVRIKLRELRRAPPPAHV